MNWTRNNNSSEEKAVNGKIYCMFSFGGGSLNNELESWQELFSRESCASRNTIACWAWGGNLNNELESKQEVFGRESCEWRNLLHLELWGGKFKQ